MLHHHPITTPARSTHTTRAPKRDQAPIDLAFPLLRWPQAQMPQAQMLCLHVLLRGLVERCRLAIRGVDVGEEVEAEADLGHEVRDGEDAHLLREAEGASALRSHDPHDRVDDPDDHNEPSEALKGVAAVALSVVEALEELHEDDDEEDEAGNPPHVPAPNMHSTCVSQLL